MAGGKVIQQLQKPSGTFQIILNKIPQKAGYDQVSNTLYNLLKSYNLTINNYSPSAVAIETKTITMPETNDKITIE